ncbi:MAG: hypothetical protein P9X24_17450 [Candidatus Hatepunaea meridiana]|nr:hypothetical protein [Candidatus Hatepunaea meridiana]
MITPKEAATEIIRDLSDDATFDDIMYRLYVRTKIERGLRDIEEGRVVSQEEAKILTSRWREK